MQNNENFSKKISSFFKVSEKKQSKQNEDYQQVKKKQKSKHKKTDSNNKSLPLTVQRINVQELVLNRRKVQQQRREKTSTTTDYHQQNKEEFKGINQNAHFQNKRKEFLKSNGGQQQRNTFIELHDECNKDRKQSLGNDPTNKEKSIYSIRNSEDIVFLDNAKDYDSLNSSMNAAAYTQHFDVHRYSVKDFQSNSQKISQLQIMSNQDKEEECQMKRRKSTQKTYPFHQQQQECKTIKDILINEHQIHHHQSEHNNGGKMNTQIIKAKSFINNSNNQQQNNRKKQSLGDFDQLNTNKSSSPLTKYARNNFQKLKLSPNIKENYVVLAGNGGSEEDNTLRQLQLSPPPAISLINDQDPSLFIFSYFKQKDTQNDEE